MEKITLPSGAILEITPLPYEEAWGVSQTIASVLEKIKIDINGIDLQNFMSTDIIKLSGPLLSIVGNKEIVDAAKLCFKRTTYNGLKIDQSTFDKKEARQDFIFAVCYALRENITPFFAGLSSFLGMN